MNEVEMISRLARSAENVDAAYADVTDRVIAALRDGGPPETSKVWRAFAAGSCLVAIFMCIAAAQTWSSLFNPLVELNGSQSLSVAQ